MKIAAEKVLEYHSPLVFGADTFEPATALQCGQSFEELLAAQQVQ
jgi:hypothetical protein